MGEDDLVRGRRVVNMNVKGIVGTLVVLGIVNALSYFLNWDFWLY